ncbi:11647_t:CDS:2 [Acaulospora colombiana]|uniref:11647_t:CDS:1 n=1 Tax=Acaulospora colombiana TaxID=27376 RepID=A0ACA9L8I9_9GLOM|nr:11647_t:CDS:2 [Acaulospora colombiana]
MGKECVQNTAMKLLRTDKDNQKETKRKDIANIQKSKGLGPRSKGSLSELEFVEHVYSNRGTLQHLDHLVWPGVMRDSQIWGHSQAHIPQSKENWRQKSGDELQEFGKGDQGYMEQRLIKRKQRGGKRLGREDEEGRIGTKRLQQDQQPLEDRLVEPKGTDSAAFDL